MAMMRDWFRFMTLRCVGIITMLAMAFAVTPMFAPPASAMVGMCATACNTCPDSDGAMMSDCAICCVVGAMAPAAPKPMLPIIGVPSALLLLPLTSRTVRPVAPPPR